MIFNILGKATKKIASDIHLTIDTVPVIRVDGKLIYLNEFKKLDRVIIDNIIMDLIDMDDKNHDISLDNVNDRDLSLDYNEYRLRINIFRQKGSLSLAIRLIPLKIPDIESLLLPKVVRNFKGYRNGLILVTGPSGSGKSTTLASIIEDINKNNSRNIITLEDPIEYIYENKNSIINQREIGIDVESFQVGIKSAMRQDPDILLIGELRDLETIASAVTLAETGHLVLATVHSKSVSETISRIIDVFPGDKQSQIRIQFANSIRAVVSQELIPRIDGGRIANCQIMIVNDVIRNLIRKESNLSTIEDQIYMNRKINGSQTREQGLAQLVEDSYVDQQVALSLVENKDKLKRLLI